MAHFAQLDDADMVIKVIVVSNDNAPTESSGISFCQSLFGDETNWVQTSYNTRGGVHRNEGEPFRKNFAGIGFSYDSDKDAFIPPKPYESWVLNEASCRWEAPTPMPNDGNDYIWDEDTTSWAIS
jgi:hypothetical protein